MLEKKNESGHCKWILRTWFLQKAKNTIFLGYHILHNILHMNIYK